jgi:glycosidase
MFGQTIILHKKNATVWSRDQMIRGDIDAVVAGQGTLFVNGEGVPFFLEANNSFAVPLQIGEGVNTIVAQITDGNGTVTSDTLRLTLGYELRPEIFTFATVSGREVTLHTSVVENTEGNALSFHWQENETNPTMLGISAADSTTTFTIPESAPPGEYYFRLGTVENDDDTVFAETYVTVSANDIRPFDIKNDHAAWIDRAIIYEITPYNFVLNGKFNDITNKLPQIAQLGINTIWLQPIYGTRFRGQGYDVTNYFGVRPDLGTEDELRTLIATAKNLGLRVMFDFVPNHTSIEHPYARDASEYGEDSHYYDFYRPIKDNVRYDTHYNERTRGLITFTYYFWEDLPNLNYDNPEVQRMMIEAGKHWIETLDIDGYRIDAVWGLNARNSEFMKRWRLALKRIKPDVLLLAEDKATDPEGIIFDERFDAAYDWYPEEDWVSHWVWQTNFSESSNPTIFNYITQTQRGSLLRNALTNNGRGYHPKAKILRFMENNDTFRFVATHDLERTKMTATLMFSLHGIPLMYQGQEIGYHIHPYETGAIYLRSLTMAALDDERLIPFYRALCFVRQNYPALHSDNFAFVPVAPNVAAVAYRRWHEEQNIFGVINMGASAINAQLSLPLNDLNLDTTKTYYLTDLLNGNVLSGSVAELTSVNLPISRYTTRLLILADSVVVTSVEEPISAPPLPSAIALEQNYPNPFNPTTTIEFDLPSAGPVELKVFDVRGRTVATLIDGHRSAGSHRAQFDGGRLASGVYFYRLKFDGQSLVRKMLLVR